MASLIARERMIREIVEAHGGQLVECCMGSKHIKAWAIYKGQRFRIVVPATPSDPRSDMNARSDIRRNFRRIDAR